ncbi:MAG: hypothetical protein DRN78_02810, partial [Thermoproteota archaeon]
EEKNFIIWLIRNHNYLNYFASTYIYQMDELALLDLVNKVEPHKYHTLKLTLLYLLSWADRVAMNPEFPDTFGLYIHYKRLSKWYGIAKIKIDELYKGRQTLEGWEENLRKKMCNLIISYYGDKREVQLYLNLLLKNELYEIDVTKISKEVVLQEINLIEEVLKNKSSGKIAIEVFKDEDRHFEKYYKIIVCLRPDRVGLLSDLAGVFWLHNLDIKEARIRTDNRKDVVLDTFYVRTEEKINLKRLKQALREDLRKVLVEGKTIERLAKEYNKEISFLRKDKFFTQIKFGERKGLTILEIKTADRAGLIYIVATVLKKLRINILKALISTYGLCIQDTFYITENGRLISLGLENKIRKRLKILDKERIIFEDLGGISPVLASSSLSQENIVEGMYNFLSKRNLSKIDISRMFSCWKGEFPERKITPIEILFSFPSYLVKELNLPSIKFPSHNTALLVIDIQNDFCQRGEEFAYGKREIEKNRDDLSPIQYMVNKNLVKLIEKARQNNVNIVFIQAEYKENQFKDMPKLCIKGSQGGEFYKVKPDFERGEKVFSKNKHDAFENQLLKEYLLSKNIKYILITGVTTDNCIKAAFDSNLGKEFKRYVIGDCVSTAGYKLLTSHIDTLKYFKERRGLVYLSQISLSSSSLNSQEYLLIPLEKLPPIGKRIYNRGRNLTEFLEFHLIERIYAEYEFSKVVKKLKKIDFDNKSFKEVIEIIFSLLRDHFNSLYSIPGKVHYEYYNFCGPFSLFTQRILNSSGYPAQTQVISLPREMKESIKKTTGRYVTHHVFNIIKADFKKYLFDGTFKQFERYFLDRGFRSSSAIFINFNAKKSEVIVRRIISSIAQRIDKNLIYSFLKEVLFSLEPKVRIRVWNFLYSYLPQFRDEYRIFLALLEHSPPSALNFLLMLSKFAQENEFSKDSQFPAKFWNVEERNIKIWIECLNPLLPQQIIASSLIDLPPMFEWDEEKIVIKPSLYSPSDSLNYKFNNLFKTSFFRDYESQLQYFKEILRSILDSKESPRGKKLRVWSIGSSFGKEAYTIAIIISELFTRNLERWGNIDNWDIKILATDISLYSLYCAKRGYYREEDVRELPSEYKIDSFFERENDRYTVKKALSTLVEFQYLDLRNQKQLEEIPSLSFDTVFCKNVFRYLLGTEQEMRERALNVFHKIKPGGYLIGAVGEEQLFVYINDEDLDGVFIPYSEGEGIYKKEEFGIHSIRNKSGSSSIKNPSNYASSLKSLKTPRYILNCVAERSVEKFLASSPVIDEDIPSLLIRCFERVEEERNKAGISISKLCRESGVSLSTYEFIRLRRRRPINPVFILELLKYFGLEKRLSPQERELLNKALRMGTKGVRKQLRDKDRIISKRIWKEVIRRLKNIRRKELKEVSKKLNIPYHTLQSWQKEKSQPLHPIYIKKILQYFNLLNILSQEERQRLNRKIKEIDKISYYQQGENSLRKIAKEINSSHQTVKNIIARIKEREKKILEGVKLGILTVEIKREGEVSGVTPAKRLS